MASTSCRCSVTELGAWGCSKWVNKHLQQYSDSSTCNFFQIDSEADCITHKLHWDIVSKLFYENLRNDKNEYKNGLKFEIINAIWVGNGPAIQETQKYREKLQREAVSDVTSKYLYHVARTVEDTFNICKTGFRMPQPHNPICGRCAHGTGIYSGQLKYVAGFSAGLSTDIGHGQRINGEILTNANPLKMLVCEVIPGKSYLAVRGEKQCHSLEMGYNSHICGGAPPLETVVFDPKAIRPAYIIEVIKCD